MGEHQNVIIAAYRNEVGLIVMLICYVFEVTWGEGTAWGRDGCFSLDLDMKTCYTFTISTAIQQKSWRLKRTNLSNAERLRMKMERVYGKEMVDYIEVQYDQHEAVRVITEHLSTVELKVDDLFEWGSQSEVILEWIDFSCDQNRQAWKNEIIHALKTKSKLPCLENHLDSYPRTHSSNQARPPVSLPLPASNAPIKVEPSTIQSCTIVSTIPNVTTPCPSAAKSHVSSPTSSETPASPKMKRQYLPIKLGRREFPTKTAVHSYLRDLLHNSKIGLRFSSGTETYDILCALMEYYHPEKRARKFGAGVSHFSIDATTRNQRNIVIYHVDGNTEVFSISQLMELLTVPFVLVPTSSTPSVATKKRVASNSATENTPTLGKKQKLAVSEPPTLTPPNHVCPWQWCQPSTPPCPPCARWLAADLKPRQTGYCSICLKFMTPKMIKFAGQRWCTPCWFHVGEKKKMDNDERLKVELDYAVRNGKKKPPSSSVLDHGVIHDATATATATTAAGVDVLSSTPVPSIQASSPKQPVQQDLSEMFKKVDEEVKAKEEARRREEDQLIQSHITQIAGWAAENSSDPSSSASVQRLHELVCEIRKAAQKEYTKS